VTVKSAETAEDEAASPEEVVEEEGATDENKAQKDAMTCCGVTIAIE
jgi:hypothetical protein